MCFCLSSLAIQTSPPNLGWGAPLRSPEILHQRTLDSTAAHPTGKRCWMAPDAKPERATRQQHPQFLCGKLRLEKHSSLLEVSASSASVPCLSCHPVPWFYSGCEINKPLRVQLGLTILISPREPRLNSSPSKSPWEPPGRISYLWSTRLLTSYYPILELPWHLGWGKPCSTLDTMLGRVHRQNNSHATSHNSPKKVSWQSNPLSTFYKLSSYANC